ncbi:lactate/malate family dehydrogenase [uncultured Enterococcus sp.]|uniref:lactate/malate family dehydrogenase n=1 Tax=uncultured Enterococcus sp. TaxID=167972 RepID=UPI0025FBC122|nr:NAD-binding protein [uncultured Enterococcus sp.]
MSKIGIIGIGNVGSTLAHTLIERHHVTDLYLFDKNKERCVAEQQDLICAQIGQKTTTTIHIGQKEDLATLDLVVFSVGNIRLLNGSGSRFDELDFTKKAAKEWSKYLTNYAFKGILLVITNPCDVITHYMQQLTNFETNRVIGTGTSLDTARLQHALSLAFDVMPNAINALVLGEHGATQFVPWDYVKTLNPQLDFTKHDLEQLANQALMIGETTFTGKGYTSFGIANQADQLICALTSSQKTFYPVSAYDSKQDIYIGQYASLNYTGIIDISPISLTEKEEQAYQKSVSWIKEMATHI